jgi:hypothetical protein
MKFSNEFSNQQDAASHRRQAIALTAQPVSQSRVLPLAGRLAEAAKVLEHLDQERAAVDDPTLGKIIEERIVSRELRDLELQAFDEEVERLSFVARDFLAREMIAGIEREDACGASAGPAPLSRANRGLIA